MTTPRNTRVIPQNTVEGSRVLTPSPEGEARWIDLRDALGKLQAKWDPNAGILEIQRRGVKTRYRLEVMAVSESVSD